MSQTAEITPHVARYKTLRCSVLSYKYTKHGGMVPFKEIVMYQLSSYFWEASGILSNILNTVRSGIMCLL